VDLSASMSLRFQRMLSLYEQYRIDNKVVPVPPGYTQIKQVVFNLLLSKRDAILVFLLTLLLLLPFYVAYRMKSRMKSRMKNENQINRTANS